MLKEKVENSEKNSNNNEKSSQNGTQEKHTNQVQLTEFQLS